VEREMEAARFREEVIEIGTDGAAEVDADGRGGGRGLIWDEDGAVISGRMGSDEGRRVMIRRRCQTARNRGEID
jgi:hypothetical protein